MSRRLKLTVRLLIRNY